MFRPLRECQVRIWGGGWGGVRFGRFVGDWCGAFGGVAKKGLVGSLVHGRVIVCDLIGGGVGRGMDRNLGKPQPSASDLCIPGKLALFFKRSVANRMRFSECLSSALNINLVIATWSGLRAGTFKP